MIDFGNVRDAEITGCGIVTLSGFYQKEGQRVTLSGPTHVSSDPRLTPERVIEASQKQGTFVSLTTVGD